MLYCEVEEESVVFEQGSEGDCFFILQEGSCSVLLDGKVGRELTAPDGFGETALLAPTSRTTSVRANTKCTFWVIDRQLVKEVLDRTTTEQHERNREYLEALRFFNYLSNGQKEEVTSALVRLQYRKGQVLVQEGDPGSTFYVIIEGNAAVLSSEQEIGKLYPGDHFGECALYYNVERRVSVRADSDLTCLVLGRQSLLNIFGKDYSRIVF
jgi:cGMP-dependent protein kinase